MGSKRKYDPEGDYSEPEPQRPSKCNRRNTHEDSDSDFYDAPKVNKRRRPAQKPKYQVRKKKKQEKSIREENEDLADYNKPPVSQSRTNSKCATLRNGVSASGSDDEYTPTTTRATRNSTKASRKHYTQSGRITKSTKIPRVALTNQERVARELAVLAPWGGVWISDEENSDSDDDEDSEEKSSDPRSHFLRYRTRTAGVQNISWGELPAEIRNSIYQYTVADEGEKALNVRHYPNGVPRRSVRGGASLSNFSQSYWGLTQVCQQKRTEFTPWLLTKRRVRTPLATLNKYIETFHRPAADGTRSGWVEPICCGAPLPGTGVEVLGLLRDKSPSFHLQLTPTTVSEVLDALVPPPVPGAYDELTIMRHLDETRSLWPDLQSLSYSALEGIYITSIIKDSDGCVADIHDDEHIQKHEILIKLDVNHENAGMMPLEKRLRYLNNFIFTSLIADKMGVKLIANLEGTIVEWVVDSSGVVLLDLRHRRSRSVMSMRKLTRDPSGWAIYIEKHL